MLGLTTLVPFVHRSSDVRRLRRVARDPRLATHTDIEVLVRAHAVPETKVWAVTDRMLDGNLDPAQVWAWTMLHDGTELADLCASRLTDREIVDLMTRLASADPRVAA